MSQFDFPRISFHGQALLDTPTANNGNLMPMLCIFDREESMPYLPPRCYAPPTVPGQPPYQFPAEYANYIVKDEKNMPYVPILPITDGNFQDWATAPLGTYTADSFYWDLYTSLGINNSTPGYWSYYGDVSMVWNNVNVTGITVPGVNNTIQTYTFQNPYGCPPALAPMLNAQLNFDAAYLCDVDAVGQMCTQIFFGQAGLTSPGGSNTYFTGSPSKATARWMNLTRVVNYSDMSLLPMAGSASFYSVIALDPGSAIAEVYSQYAGYEVTSLFMRFAIHEVYETRQPDYSKIPSQTITGMGGKQTNVRKNQAKVAITGSITPWNPNVDFKTNSIGRILKSSAPAPIDTSTMLMPQTKAGPALGTFPGPIYMAPIQLVFNENQNVVSLDILNAINEYGEKPDSWKPYAGPGDIPPFQTFENYDYGTFTLYYQYGPELPPAEVGSFDWASNYNMQQFLANGGMIDLVPQSNSYYASFEGYYYITLNTNTGPLQIYTEEDIYVTSDQNGIYAEQNQPAQLFMNDGLPRVACTLRVFYRGVPIPQSAPVKLTLQQLDMVYSLAYNSDFFAYDGVQFNPPVDADGCFTYSFVSNPADLLPANFNHSLSLFTYILSAHFVVVRVLSQESQLKPYINNPGTITWEVIYNNIFQLYKLIYPIMDAVMPFNEQTWSSPTVLSRMLQLIDEKNWNTPLYMPVTRDLSSTQRQLLQLWANQILNGSNAR